MTSINGVDVGDVVADAVSAAKVVASNNWGELRDIVENIANGILNDVQYVAAQKLAGTLDEYGAKIFLEDQRMVARVRLRSVAIVTLNIAEDIMNAIIAVFNGAVNRALGWTLF